MYAEFQVAFLGLRKIIEITTHDALILLLIGY